MYDVYPRRIRIHEKSPAVDMANTNEAMVQIHRTGRFLSIPSRDDYMGVENVGNVLFAAFGLRFLLVSLHSKHYRNLASLMLSINNTFITIIWCNN